jgi:hypothetical protein
MMAAILRRARLSLTAAAIAACAGFAVVPAAAQTSTDTVSVAHASRDSALARAASAEHPPGPRADLAQHVSLAFASGLAVGLVTQKPAAAAGTAISLGLIKEWMDPRFDRSDLLADLVGAALAAWATHALKL